MTTRPLLSRLLLLFALTAFAATSYAAPPPDHWVGTWATAPFAANNGRPATRALACLVCLRPRRRNRLARRARAAHSRRARAARRARLQCRTCSTPTPAAAPPAFVYGTADTTLREIVHVSIGGPELRVIFTNEFGTEPLTIGAAHVAISQGGSTINLVSAAGLTFGGHASVIIPPGALVGQRSRPR